MTTFLRNLLREPFPQVAPSAPLSRTEVERLVAASLSRQSERLRAS